MYTIVCGAEGENAWKRWQDKVYLDLWHQTKDRTWTEMNSAAKIWQVVSESVFHPAELIV